MSRVTTEARLWRKKGRRGVSPIIATILLVAITVVLAAVLYILISGLTGSSGSKPYTVGFGTGNPSSGGANLYYDELPVSVTSGLTTGLFSVKVTTPTGTGIAAVADNSGAATACGYTAATGVMSGAAGAFTTCTVGVAGWYAVLANQNGNVVAVFDSAGWHLQPGTTAQAISNSMEIVVVSYSVYAGSANTLSVYGSSSSSVSGSTVL
jgi:flagellin-like protein